MPFRQARADTRVDTVEERYGINLNARGDALLGNLLQDRGFDSLSQFLSALRGHARTLARKRRLFLSFHADDRAQVQGFRLMAKNPRLDFDFYDASVRSPVNSANSSYIRQVIQDKIYHAAVVVCLIGNSTAWRDWVDWELNTGYSYHKGLCGVRLKDTRGRTPTLLRDIGAPVARWDLNEIVAAIERAAANRS